MENKMKWLRDIIFIPIMIALVFFLLSFAFQKIPNKGKQITYSIDGPSTLIDTTKLNSSQMSLKVNDEGVSKLYIYKVILTNTGSEPISDLPVRIVFNTDSPNFKIYSISHETLPRLEFGEINEEYPDLNSIRFVYDLMNAKDQDSITIITNLSQKLEVFSKSDGLVVKEIQTNEPSLKNTDISLMITLVAGFSTFLLTILQKLRKDRN